MNIKLSLNLIGHFLKFLGLLMLAPAVCSFIYGEDDLETFLISAIITSLFGLTLELLTKTSEDFEELERREAFLIASLCWLAASIFGAIPYIVYGVFQNPVDAFFESVSGFTTTGASVMKDIELFPHGILFWRNLTQWLGGMGIIILGIAILPRLAVGGMQLMSLEVPGPTTEKLTPRITQTARALLIGFDDVESAGACVAAIIGAGIIPAGMEMMDKPAIQAAEAFVNVGYPLDVEALLIVELDGPQAEVAELIGEVERIGRAQGAVHIRVSHDEAERELFWAGRKAAFPAVGRISPDYYCMDGTIPRKQLPLVLNRMAELSVEHGLRVANVFHAGDGNLHPMILYDANRPEELERAERFGADILRLCVEVGGVLTGEHGVGVEKRDLMGIMFDDDDLKQQQRLKCAFDPEGLLNPGKVFPVLHRCAELGRVHTWGPLIETAPQFPNRTNVQLVHVRDDHTIQIEIWERGAGYTLASGTSASAAAAAAVRTGRCPARQLTVQMAGGNLTVEVLADGVRLTGPVTAVYQATFSPDLLAQFAP